MNVPLPAELKFRENTADLGSASDWLCHVRNLLQPTEALPKSCSSMDFLHLFFRWRNQKMSAVFSGYTIYSSLYVA